MASRRNLQEEPGSSNQSVSGVNSVGASGCFRGAMMLSDEDIDPEIDSAASNDFTFNPNGSRNASNFAHAGDSQDYWQASSSSSANNVGTGQACTEADMRTCDRGNEENQ